MDDYISKKVEKCSNLDDFILKLKQGRMVKLANKMDYYYFTLPISDNLKVLYRKSSDYGCDFEFFNIEKLEERFCGLLDCGNNKLLLEKYDYNYMINNSSQSEIIRLDTVIEQVDELLCRYQSDKDCESLEDKSLVKKDLSLDCKKEYDNIQKLAMGINNFLYVSLERLKDFRSSCVGEKENFKNILMSCVMGYLDEGLDYLKNVDKSKLYRCRGARYTEEKYFELCKRYTDIKGNIDKLIKQEISEVLEYKSSVWINEIKANKPLYDQYYVWPYGEYNRRMLYEDINTIKYKGKEIFNREKTVVRLSSSEYQAGIDSLIEFVSNNFDRYNNESLDLENINAGNLIYSKNGHFGVVIAKDKIYLDNGVQADINDINICFKDEELDEGLKQMKKFISREYNNELQKVIAKNQKEQEEKEVETEVER